MLKSFIFLFSLSAMSILGAIDYQCIPLMTDKMSLDEIIAINDQGSVLGIGTVDKSNRVYFLWNQKDGLKNLNEVIPNLQEVIAMNDQGTIMGLVNGQIFLWKKETLQMLETQLESAKPIGINNKDEVLFSAVNDKQQQEYYLWNHSSVGKVATPKMSDLGGIVSFNDLGKMLYLNMTDGNFSVIQNGKSTLFSERGAFLISSKMNQKGDVVGIRISEKAPKMSGIVWFATGKKMQISKPNFDVAMIDMNDEGQAIGAMGESGNEANPAKSILWTQKDGISLINDLMDKENGCHVDFSLKINNLGQILAWGKMQNHTGFLLLTPKN